MNEKRVYNIAIYLIIIMLIIIGKLFYIQVVDDKYEKWSYNNSVRINVLQPSRGKIVDRNGLILAQNKEAYKLFVTPRELESFDTTMLGNILEISNFKIDSILNICKKYSYRKPSLLIRDLSQIQKLRIEELNIDGLHTEYSSVRFYPDNIAGNILGYTSIVSQRDRDLDKYYDIQDHIGRTGIEKTYEDALRGSKGQSFKSVNVHGAIVDSYMDGSKDYPSVPGKDLTTTIDIRIQKLGEELMENKIGAIVAIEPSTGEILAMISAPTYDPNLLIGNARSENYNELIKNPRRPFINRTTSGVYPPGSIFKIPIGLTAIQSGTINYSTMFSCHNGFIYGNFRLGCHDHYSPIKFEYAIQTSCNSYFCNAFRMHISSDKYTSVAHGLDEWKKQMANFGFGSKLNSDVENESLGYIPDSKLYDRTYGKNRWNPINIISISIGQGEILATPLQLANLGAIIANKGHYHTPHLVNGVNNETDIDYTAKHRALVDSTHFEYVINAMWKSVNESGTGVIAKVDGLDICGKTGTIQNGSGTDHSAFLAIAPKVNPKIAIVVYVENGGFGSTVAAPIASLLIEKYLTDTIERPALYNKMIKHIIKYPQYDKVEQ